MTFFARGFAPCRLDICRGNCLHVFYCLRNICLHADRCAGADSCHVYYVRGNNCHGKIGWSHCDVGGHILSHCDVNWQTVISTLALAMFRVLPKSLIHNEKKYFSEMRDVGMPPALLCMSDNKTGVSYEHCTN